MRQPENETSIRDHGPAGTGVPRDRQLRALEDRMGEVAAQLDTEYISLGVYRGNSAPEMLHQGSNFSSSGWTHAHPVLCSIKLLTATLIVLLSEKYAFDLHTSLSGLLKQFGRSETDLLPNVSVMQLLAHTHGLAAYPMASQRDQSFWTAIASASRLFEPGELYNYDSLGYEVLGKLVEEVCGERFEDVLFREVLSRLSSEQCRDRFGHTQLQQHSEVSSSAGHGLFLTLADLICFCRSFTGSGDPSFLPQQLVSQLLKPVMRMPGWTPYVNATCLGFRDFGNDWYGHNGADQNCLTFIRVSPIRKSAICLIARSNRDNLGLLPIMLLRNFEPALFAQIDKQPRIDAKKVLTEPHPLLAQFSDYRRTLRPYLENGRLNLQVFERSGDGTQFSKVHDCHLYPAENEIYLLAKPWGKINFIQLIQKHGKFYLWDAAHTLPQCANT